MKLKELAKKVDILIPTHNRPLYLKRILEYYNLHGSDFNFIITDSSNKKNKALNKAVVKSYPNLKITYKDYFSESLVQSIKFGETAKLASSKYCVFCGDDDFIIPSAIYEAVRFLEKNKDYVAAHGIYIGFHLFKNLLGGENFWWRFRYTPHTISANSPIGRLDFHLRNYVHLIWSVRRTEVVKTVYKEFLRTKADPKVLAVMGELIPDSLTILYGKAKALNIFFGARQYFGSVISYYPTLLDAKASGIYQKEFKKYMRIIMQNLRRLGFPANKKTSDIIDKAFDKYNSFSRQEHFMNQLILFLSRYPGFLLQIVRFLHIYYIFSKANQNTLGEIDKKESKYHQDFINIKTHVLNSITN